MKGTGDGWRALDYAYTHNRAPKPQPPIFWEQALAQLGKTELEVLRELRVTNSPIRAELRPILHAKGAYRRRYIPECVLEAFGWKDEVEMLVSDGRGGRLRDLPKTPAQK